MMIVNNKTTVQNKITFSTKLMNLISDESGAETMEYAIVLGLVTVAAIGIVGKFGTKVLARWSSVNSSI